MGVSTIPSTIKTHIYVVGENTPEQRGNKLEVSGQTYIVGKQIDISKLQLEKILSFYYIPQGATGRDEANGVTGTIVEINYT